MCLGDIFETESLFLEPKKKQQAVIFFRMEMMKETFFKM